MGNPWLSSSYIIPVPFLRPRSFVLAKIQTLGQREKKMAPCQRSLTLEGGVFVSCVSFRGMCLLFGSLGLSLPRWLTATSRLILSFSCGGVSWYPVVTLLSQSVCPYLSLEDVS